MLKRRHLSAAGATALTLLVAGGLAACGGDAAARDQTPPTSATPTATPTPPPSFYSGTTKPNGPVLVVKLDNSDAALPHIGLTSADLVYVQQVEGGISRLAAVFSTTIPDVVAPIRSARETDAQLFPQFGSVPLAFSGSVRSVHRLIDQAGLIDVSADEGPRGYYRLSARRAPHNLAGKPDTLLGRAKGADDPRDIGLRFGKAPVGGTPAETASAKMMLARVGFAYNARTGRYDVSLNGVKDRTKAEGQVGATTVVFQSVPVSMLARGDSKGTSVPFTTTVGKGQALILRDGKAYEATWARPSKGKGTRFTYRGKDFPMKAGQVWIVLLDDERTPSVS
jgi:hypothetical protein